MLTLILSETTGPLTHKVGPTDETIASRASGQPTVRSTAPRSPGGGGRRLLGCGGLAAAAGLIVVMGAAVAVFLGYRSAGGPSAPVAALQTSIANPADGSEVGGGSPVVVEAVAFGPEAVVSMELWVDGELAGVQAAPPGGRNHFASEFAWLPEPGTHALVTRAMDAADQSAYSPSVIVLVTPTEVSGQGDDNVVRDVPTVLPAAEGSFAPPVPPGASDGVGPSESWQGSPGNWVTSLTANAPPAAPELVAEAEGCSAKLSVHDLSNNEEGFAVYRQTPSSPTWQQIETLASQSQKDWLTYTDSGMPGGSLYYVSALNSQGETASNLALVNVDPAACAPDGEGLPAINVELVNLTPQVLPDLTYCYLSLDGVNWARMPEIGFLTPDTRGVEVEGQAVQVLLTGIDGAPLSQTHDLLLECWGWLGSDLQFLGELVLAGIGPDTLGSFPLNGAGLSAEVLVSLHDALEPPVLYPLSGDGDLFIPTGSQMKDLIAYNTVDPQMPWIVAFVTQDPDECKEHLPQGLQNEVGKVLLCFPYDGFDAGLGSENPQSYLAWNVECYQLLFDEDSECKSYGYWLSLAADLGGQVGFRISDASNGGSFSYKVTADEMTALVIPPVACTGSRKFNVRMWYTEGGVTIYGPFSNEVVIACPQPSLDDEVLVEISFDTLQLSLLDDGESGPDNVELYGYFRARAPSWAYEIPEDNPLYDVHSILGLPTTLPGLSYLNIAKWNEQEDGCPDDSVTLFGVAFLSENAACPVRLTDGTFGLSEFFICQSSSYTKCTQTGFLQNNNTIYAIVTEGDYLRLSTFLVDWDDASANDLTCEAGIYTASKTLAEWNNLQNEPFTLVSPDQGNGSCVIEGVISKF